MKIEVPLSKELFSKEAIEEIKKLKAMLATRDRQIKKLQHTIEANARLVEGTRNFVRSVSDACRSNCIFWSELMEE